MYRSLTGQAPLLGQTDLDVMHKHVREFAQPMGSVVPLRAIPQAMERIIQKCLAKEPSNRYQSMAELKHTLLTLPYGSTAAVPQSLSASASESNCHSETAPTMPALPADRRTAT